MGGSGSALFSDADEYEANLPGKTRLVVEGGSEFRARLTWMELTDLHLIHARETVPRIAYVSLPNQWVFMVFPTHRTSALVCDGVHLVMGDIICLGPGGRFHQRIDSATAWGSIALTPASLRMYGKILAGRDVVAPCGQILRPLPADWSQLRRLYAEAIRIAERGLGYIGHPEVARAVAQDLIWALVSCLTAAEPRAYCAATRRHVRLLAQFEDALIACPGGPLHVSQVCEVIGVSERTLRTCCFQFLGMGPGQYLRLRRFKRMSVAPEHLQHD